MIDVLEQSKIPTRELYSGEKIPCVGLGTFGSDKYGADAVSEAVYGAVKYGYRLIDCASVNILSPHQKMVLSIQP